MSFVFCKTIGRISRVLEGEVVFKHPLRDADIRGVLVSLTLTDPSAARKTVLHLGGKPLGF